MRGHIRRRGDAYRLEVSAGRDPNTGRYRKVQRTVHGTRREAEAKLRQLVAEVEGGVGLTLDPRHLTLRSFLEKHYLPWAESRGLSPETLEGYRLKTRWLDEVGDIRLDKLRPLHVEAWVRRMSGLAPSTVGSRLAFVRRVLGQAVKWRVLPWNPAADVAGPRQPRVERTLMEPEVARSLMDTAMGSPVEVPVLLALGCGLRRSEVLGLRWSDVDFEAMELHVAQAVGEVANVPYLKGPKSDAGRRAVPLPRFVAESLQRHRRALSETRLAAPTWQDLDLVFPAADGGLLRRDLFQRRWFRVRDRAGVAVRFHDLRHGFATLAGAGGVDLNTLKELMGHSSVSVTADLYQKALDRQKRRAASVLDDVVDLRPKT